MQTINLYNYKIYINEKTDADNLITNDFFKCEQVHSSNIYLRKPGDFIPSQADGIITNMSHKKLAVRVADCNAIILMGKDYFGIIHAGRKGLESDILDKAIKILREAGETDITMYVGPSIRECCYIVGKEFKDIFDNKYLISRAGMLYLDMISIIKDTANKNGIKKITIHPDCTCCSNNYFSYRRGDKNTRMLILVEKTF